MDDDRSLIGLFVARVRGILGLRKADPAEIWRWGLYNAEVKAVAGDGSTVDIQPEDPRLSPEKGVRLRLGVPGSTTVVKPGSIVLFGWERGDPSMPYIAAAWEPGAGVAKLQLRGDAIDLNPGGPAAARVTDPTADGSIGMGQVTVMGVTVVTLFYTPEGAVQPKIIGKLTFAGGNFVGADATASPPDNYDGSGGIHAEPITGKIAAGSSTVTIG